MDYSIIKPQKGYIVIKEAEEEKYTTDIQSGYNQLLEEIKTKKTAELAINKEEIIAHISDEILKQFYFKKGMYQNKFIHDKVIKKATELLNDDKKYTKILK